jgi:hypothetical protein
MNVSDDFVEATASENRELLELAARTRLAADAAIKSRDMDELIASLEVTVELLDAVVIDLTASLGGGRRGVCDGPGVPPARRRALRGRHVERRRLTRGAAATGACDLPSRHCDRSASARRLRRSPRTAEWHAARPPRYSFVKA